MLHTAIPVDTEHLTVAPAARLLGVAEGTVRQLADRGRLPCTRIGTLRVFAVADVLALRTARLTGATR